jgi:dimethylargininase
MSDTTSRRYGGHSMTAPLKRVMVRKPAAPATADDWRRFNYAHPIDINKTIAEHSAFCAIIEEQGIEVITAGPDPAGRLDAIFCFDPSIVTDGGAVLLRPGKGLRVAEVALHEESYGLNDVPVLGRIEAPGTVEAGDTMWIDDKHLAVGRGYRTNKEGIRQLTEIMARVGVTVLAFDLAHYTGPAACLHLLSFISPVAEKVAAVHPPLMPVSFIETLREFGWRMIDIDPNEYITQATNILALEPGKLLMLQGNPVTKARLEFNGYQVLTYVGEELSWNREGGPTCLTRPLLRG